MKRGLSDTDETFAVAVHGGAIFEHADHGRTLAFVQQALSEARAALSSGARAIDVAAAAIAGMAGAGLFNAAKGARARGRGQGTAKRDDLTADYIEGRCG